MSQVQGTGAGASGTINKKAPKKTPAGVNPRTGKGYGSIGFSASASAIPASLTNRASAKPAGGSRNYGGGGGGVGSNRTGGISGYAPPPAPPAPPNLEAFSAKDSTYQSQLSALKKALADYQAQQGQAKNQYLTSYAGDARTLGENRTQGLDDLSNDYSSRGMLQSGLYADSLSDLNGDFDKRQSALDQARAQFLAQQGSDFTNYSSEQQIAQQKALQEAAARRAAQYGG